MDAPIKVGIKEEGLKMYMTKMRVPSSTPKDVKEDTVHCTKCNQSILRFKAWWCSDCKKASFCEPCYNEPGSLRWYGCCVDGMQCDKCYATNGPLYCIDDICNCENGPPPDGSAEAKRKFRILKYLR